MENLAFALLMTIVSMMVVGSIALLTYAIREAIQMFGYTTITWKAFFTRVFIVILIITLITAFWYVILFTGGGN